MKRLFDIAVSIVVLALLSPLLVVVAFLIWLGDRRSPFYIASRMGRNHKPFCMVKFRSMRIGADKSGVDSTSKNDNRITPVGAFVRKYKVDELPQLWNVLKGDMSLVGPRPNVEREVRLYSIDESYLLDARPGITDLASIVFADEGDILADEPDPDIAYNQLIRPGKSRLGLFYVKHRTLGIDLAALRLTVMNSLDREKALAGVSKLLEAHGADADLAQLALRKATLVPSAPPGLDHIVTSRDG